MKNHIVFVCQIIPSELLLKYPVSPAQTHFCDKLLLTGCFDKVISLVQTNVVPYILDEIVDERNVEYIQVRLLRQNKWTRIINNLIESIMIVCSCKGYNHIIYNNINHQTFISCIINKLVFRRKVYAIVTDHTPPKSKISFQAMLEFLLVHMDGVITLSPRMKVPIKNRFSIAGIVPNDSIKPCTIMKRDSKCFLFSGTLNEAKGIRLALECFSQNKDLKLIITGSGPLKKVVEKYSSMYENIQYLGFLEEDSYWRVLDDVCFCLNLRNPYLEENMNNFPSKILEYFANNKIVISTMYYPELQGMKYYTCDYRKDDLEKCIRNIICNMKESNTIIDNSLSLKSKFSEDAWRSIINHMIAVKR